MYKEIENLFVLSRMGDKKAKEDLLKKLHPLIISSIRRYYNRINDYDDLIQDGYETVLKCIQDYDPIKDVRFLGYVKTMLRFCYLNKHKEKQHISLNEPVKDGKEGEIGDFIPDDRDYLKDIFEREEKIRLYNSLNSLTDRQRQIVINYYINNLSIGQIADKMGISYRTVINTKVTALKKLKDLIVK